MSDHDEDILDPAVLLADEDDSDINDDALLKRDMADEDDWSTGLNLDNYSEEDVI